MNVSIDDLLLALGEKTAENFALRRQVAELEATVRDLQAPDKAWPMREGPRPVEEKQEGVVHAQPDPQLWPDRER